MDPHRLRLDNAKEVLKPALVSFGDCSDKVAARVAGFQNFTLTCEKEILYTPPKMFKEVAVEKATGKQFVVRNGTVRSHVRLESNGLLWLLTETPLEMNLLNRSTDLTESQVAQGKDRADLRSGKSGRISMRPQSLPEDTVEFALGLRMKGASGRVPASFWKECDVIEKENYFHVEWHAEVPQANGIRIHKWRFRNIEGVPLEDYSVLWREGNDVYRDLEVHCSEFSVSGGVAVPRKVSQREYFGGPGRVEEITKTISLSNLKCEFGNAPSNPDAFQATWLPDSYIHDERSDNWIHISASDTARKLPDRVIGNIQVDKPRVLVRTSVVIVSIITAILLCLAGLHYIRRRDRPASKNAL